MYRQTPSAQKQGNGQRPLSGAQLMPLTCLVSSPQVCTHIFRAHGTP